MALPDVGTPRNERIWAADQPTFGTLAAPVAGDLIRHIEGSLAMVDYEFATNLERRDTPGRGRPIKRKEAVAEFSLSFYLKVPATAGYLFPEEGLLIRKLLGTEKAVLTVLDFAHGVGESVTVVVDGTSTVLTEGSGGDFDAETSNEVTATNLAAAIHALSGVAATAAGAVITVTRDAGVASVRITTSEAMFVEHTYTEYTPASDKEEDVCSFWHWTGNRMEGWRDCKPTVGRFVVSGTDEPRLTLTGILGHMVGAGPTTLAAGYTSGGTQLTLTAPKVLAGIGTQDGVLVSKTTDVHYLKVDSEVFKVAAVNYTTGVCEVTGGQFGTSPANHSNGATVEPWKPGADPDPNDEVKGITLGDVKRAGVEITVVTAEASVNLNLEPLRDEFGEPALTGIVPRAGSSREVDFTLTAHQRTALQPYLSEAAREVEGTLVITAGVDSAPHVTVTMPTARFTTATKGASNVFDRTLPGQAIESSGNDEIAVRYLPD